MNAGHMLRCLGLIMRNSVSKHLEFRGLVKSKRRHLHNQETFVCFQTFPYYWETRRQDREENVDPARAKVKDGNQPKERGGEERKEKRSSGAEQDIATQERGRK